MERSPAKKDLGVLVDRKLDMSQHCALLTRNANWILGCIKSSAASRSGRGPCTSALHCEASPGALHPDVESSVQERHGAFRARPEQGHKNDPRDGTPLLQDRLRELGLCSMEKGGLQGELRAACQYLKGRGGKGRGQTL